MLPLISLPGALSASHLHEVEKGYPAYQQSGRGNKCSCIVLGLVLLGKHRIVKAYHGTGSPSSPWHDSSFWLAPRDSARTVSSTSEANNCSFGMDSVAQHEFERHSI